MLAGKKSLLDGTLATTEVSPVILRMMKYFGFEELPFLN
jgi:hypothetical protein